MKDGNKEGKRYTARKHNHRGAEKKGNLFLLLDFIIFVSLLVSEISVQGAVEYDYSLHCWPQRSRNWLRALLKSTMVIVTVK